MNNLYLPSWGSTFQHLLSLNRILTITLVVIAIIAASVTVYILEENAINSYGSEISYKVTKLPLTFDSSCGTNSEEVGVSLTNMGSKTVTDLTVNVSNPVCVGAVPVDLPTMLNKSSTLTFSVSSTDMNGTITVAGNYTLVTISF